MVLYSKRGSQGWFFAPDRPIVVYSERMFFLPMQCTVNIWPTELCTWAELFHKWSVYLRSPISDDQLIASSASHITSVYVLKAHFSIHLQGSEYLSLLYLNLQTTRVLAICTCVAKQRVDSTTSNHWPSHCLLCKGNRYSQYV